jgi:hypothetical protein
MSTFSTVLYILNTAGSALVGFIGGALFGRSIRQVNDVVTVVAEVSEEPDDQATVPQTGKTGWFDRVRKFSARFPTQPAIGVIVVVMGALTLLQGVNQNAANEQLNQENKRLTDCLVKYSDDLAAVIKVRSAGAADAQSANDQLWRTIAKNFTAGGGPALKQAIADFLAARDHALDVQKKNPYPDPPRATCS